MKNKCTKAAAAYALKVTSHSIDFESMEFFFETYKFLYIPSAIIGFGYCFYFIQGKFNERISKQPYNKLRDANFLFKQILITTGIGLAGYYLRQMMLFMPFSFLVVFWTIDQVTLLTSGKTINLGNRWNAPKNKKWSSGWNTFIVLMLTFILSLVIAVAVGIATK